MRLHVAGPRLSRGIRASPRDVAGVVAFLASSDASYLTAQRIEVDGGGPPRG